MVAHRRSCGHMVTVFSTTTVIMVPSDQCKTAWDGRSSINTCTAIFGSRPICEYSSILFPCLGKVAQGIMFAPPQTGVRSVSITYRLEHFSAERLVSGETRQRLVVIVTGACVDNRFRNPLLSELQGEVLHVSARQYSAVSFQTAPVQRGRSPVEPVEALV